MNAAHTTGSSQLLRVFDKNSKLHFLIHTGAEISVFPAGRADRFHKSDVTLRAANNSTIDHFLNERKSGYELRPQSFLGSFGGTEQR